MAFAAIGGKKISNPLAAPGPGLNNDERARLAAALSILRNLVTAKDKDRKNLIMSFQHAARIPVNGTLDALTLEAAQAATTGEADQSAIMSGLKSLPEAKQAAGKPDNQGSVPSPDMPTRADAAKPSEPTLRDVAQMVARSLRQSGANYDRQLMAAFQRAAGLKGDGLWGPKTKAALVANGVDGSTLPDPYAFAKARVPNAPPASPPTDRPASPQPGQASPSAETVLGLAQLVARNLELAQARYDRTLMQTYQRRAGLKADGVYGPKTRAALIGHGIAEKRLPASNAFSGKK